MKEIVYVCTSTAVTLILLPRPKSQRPKYAGVKGANYKYTMMQKSGFDTKNLLHIETIKIQL